MQRGRAVKIHKKEDAKVWDLISTFEECCRSKGWKAYENSDLIEAENECLKFIWVNHLHPETFKRVATAPLYAIREGISYRMVRISCMAWVLLETPSASICRMVRDTPSLSRRVAVYDLSRAHKEKPKCLRLNETESVVLQEFEWFLNAEYGIRLVPLTLEGESGRRLAASTSQVEAL